MQRVNYGLLFSIFGFPLVIAVAGGFSGDGLAYAIVATVVTALATILVAAPLLVWCRRRGWLSIWPFIAGGAFSGFIFSLPITIFTPLFLAFFAGSGAIIGAVFWLIAIYRNPGLNEWRAFSNASGKNAS